MNACALSSSWNIVGGIGGHQDLVNHVNHTVAGVHVGKRNTGVVHRNTITHRERKGLAVDRISRHAIGKGSGRHVAGDNVVEQDVRQGRFAFGCIESSEVDTGVSKGLVGGGEEGEGPRTLKGFKQIGLHHSGHE